MIIKIYKFFQRFWEILYLPVSLLCAVVNYIIKDIELEAEELNSLVEAARKNWEEVD